MSCSVRLDLTYGSAAVTERTVNSEFIP